MQSSLTNKDTPPHTPARPPFFSLVDTLPPPPTHTHKHARARISEAPDAPPLVTAVPLSSTALNITWKRPHGNYEAVAHYAVWYRVHAVPENQWTVVTCAGGVLPLPAATSPTSPQSACSFLDRDADTDAVVTPLQTDVAALAPYTTYEVAVAASNSRGEGPKATAVVQTLQDLPSKPDPPAITALANRELSVGVSAPVPSNGVITKYTLRILMVAGTANAALDSTVVVGGGASAAHTFAALQPSTTYNITVFASTVAGNGPTSAAVQVTTLPDTPERAPVLASVASTETTCTFVWRALLPNDTHGQAATYTVYSTQEDGSDARAVGITAATTFTWTGIAPGTVHFIRLSANTTAGEGPISRVHSCETDPFPPSRPAAPTAVALCAREVRVSWQTPAQTNGQLTKYELWQEGAGAVDMRVYTGLGREVVVDELQASTTYRFYVVAFTTLASEPSAAVSITTLSGGKHRVCTVGEARQLSFKRCHA